MLFLINISLLKYIITYFEDNLDTLLSLKWNKLLLYYYYCYYYDYLAHIAHDFHHQFRVIEYKIEFLSLSVSQPM